MSRDFSNTLLFEAALDSIQTTNPILFSVSQALFNPSVDIIEEDCGTLLGNEVPSTFRSVGYTEVSTGLQVGPTRLSTLLSSGIPTGQVRTSYTCISPGGVCRVCAASSFPRAVIPPVGNRFKISPEVILDINQVTVVTNQLFVPLAYDASMYDTLYVFESGELVSELEYYISGKTLVLTNPAPADTVLTLRYLVFSNSQFYHWLCGTYSGSLLGVRQLQKTLLPIKKQILQSKIPTEDLESLIRDLKESSIGAEDSVQYIDSIKDPVEKAIFTILLASIFLNDS